MTPIFMERIADLLYIVKCQKWNNTIFISTTLRFEGFYKPTAANGDLTQQTES